MGLLFFFQSWNTKRVVCSILNRPNIQQYHLRLGIVPSGNLNIRYDGSVGPYVCIACRHCISYLTFVYLFVKMIWPQSPQNCSFAIIPCLMRYRNIWFYLSTQQKGKSTIWFCSLAYSFPWLYYRINGDYFCLLAGIDCKQQDHRIKKSTKTFLCTIK